jgi:NAD(P)-dependent dehydrogenase (short-subunit alcohol dehydrogenase family)
MQIGVPALARFSILRGILIAVGDREDLERPAEVPPLHVIEDQNGDLRVAGRAFGKLEILVNNVDIYEFAPLETINRQHFHKQFELDVLALLLTMQETVGPEGGRIIRLSSVAAALAPPSMSVYGGVNEAVNAMTRALAQELGRASFASTLSPRSGRNRGAACHRDLWHRF